MKSKQSKTASATKRRLHGVVMPPRLSLKQIQRISDALHHSVQFYDDHGNKANKQVLEQIEDCLKGIGQKVA